MVDVTWLSDVRCKVNWLSVDAAEEDVDGAETSFFWEDVGETKEVSPSFGFDKAFM